MKIPKKILSMALCALISVGGSQLTLLKANAQEVTRSNSCNVKWVEGIQLKLEDKNNPSHKYWYEVFLYNDGGSMKLCRSTPIPDCMRFADTYIFDICGNNGNGETKTRLRVTHDSPRPCNQQLDEEISKFNDNPPKVGDCGYIHGLYDSNNLKFNDFCNILHHLPCSIYTDRYDSQWDRGYRFRDDGLYEMIFRHTPTGVSLASKDYWR